MAVATASSHESPAPIQSVNKLNMSLFNKLQYNAQNIGKRFIHKSSAGMSSQPTVLGHSAVTHHALNRNGSTSRDHIMHQNSIMNQKSEPVGTRIEDFAKVAKEP